MDKTIRVAIACGASFALSFLWQALLPTPVAIIVSVLLGMALGAYAVSKAAPNVLPVYRVEVRADDYKREPSIAEQYPELFNAGTPWRVQWNDPDIQHLHGVPWHEAEVPPKRHECWAQTNGWIGLDQTQRCACGALRGNRFGGVWLERNSRKAGDVREKVA